MTGAEFLGKEKGILLQNLILIADISFFNPATEQISCIPSADELP